MFFFACFADAECLILAAMAYDRYAAICNPLLYSTLVSRRVCFSLVMLAYFSGSMTSLVHVSLTFMLPYCSSNIVNHFFCDIPPLLALSCADTHINELLLFALCGTIQMSTFLVIVISYFCILITVLSIKSSGGRGKTFSTCASHLMAVTLFYGTLLFMYLRPTTSYSPDTDKVQEGEYPNRLDPKIPVYAEEASPSVIVNDFSERLLASLIQRIWLDRVLDSPSQLTLVNSH
ncbi:hypothetical protein U0070_003761 [Myodes glareolus]|uniref:G-protein coupled receptors family 1 profile domain-containing protein n=1 Tax=Myodes glareolus TaxID=447135 RepID=A0AAW0HGN3_MYOGA